MSQFWSPAVHELTPYIPGEQPREKLIKLNTNENPYSPAPGVGAVLRDFPTSHLRLYPDPQSLALRQALAREHGVAVEQVFVGNGSDEVLALAFQAFFRHERPLEMPRLLSASILFNVRCMVLRGTACRFMFMVVVISNALTQISG